MPKRRFVKQIEPETGRAIIDFGNAGKLEARVTELPEEIRATLVLHGLAQKLGDSYAGISDPARARAAAESVLARLKAGEWRARHGDGSASVSPTVIELARAVARVKGISEEEALEKVQRLDRKSRNLLRAHPAIMREIAKLRAKDAPDIEELLG